MSESTKIVKLFSSCISGLHRELVLKLSLIQDEFVVEPCSLKPECYFTRIFFAQLKGEVGGPHLQISTFLILS